MSIREVTIANVYNRSASAPQDLRTVDTTPRPDGLAEQRQAAVETVIGFFGADMATATDVLVMLDLVA